MEPSLSLLPPQSVDHAFSRSLAPLSEAEDGGIGSGTSHSSLVGMLTAITGNMLIALALNVQRYAHVRILRNQEKQAALLVHLKDRTHHPDPTHASDPYSEDETTESQGPEIQGPPTNPRPTGQTKTNHAARQPNPPPMASAHPPSYGSVEQVHANKSLDDTVPVCSETSSQVPQYLSSPYWWAGMVLICVGETGNFMAYAFAPASVVSPLGVVALIANCLMAPVLFHEAFRFRDVFGVVMAVGGVVTVVLSANQEEQMLNPTDLWRAITATAFEVYLGVTLFLIAVLLWASRRFGHRSILVDLGIVGLSGGYTALATKALSSFLSTDLLGSLETPVFYLLLAVLVSSALMQVRHLNCSLQRFESTQVIPIQFVLFTLSVILGSAVLYRDFEQTTLDQAVQFAGGCFLTFFGVFLITHGREQPPEREVLDAPHRRVLAYEETLDTSETEPLLQPVTVQQQLQQQQHASTSCLARGAVDENVEVEDGDLPRGDSRGRATTTSVRSDDSDKLMPLDRFASPTRASDRASSVPTPSILVHLSPFFTLDPPSPSPPTLTCCTSHACTGDASEHASHHHPCEAPSSGSLHPRSHTLPHHHPSFYPANTPVFPPSPFSSVVLPVIGSRPSTPHNPSPSAGRTFGRRSRSHEVFSLHQQPNGPPPSLDASAIDTADTATSTATSTGTATCSRRARTMSRLPSFSRLRDQFRALSLPRRTAPSDSFDHQAACADVGTTDHTDHHRTHHTRHHIDDQTRCLGGATDDGDVGDGDVGPPLSTSPAHHPPPTRSPSQMGDALLPLNTVPPNTVPRPDTLRAPEDGQAHAVIASTTDEYGGQHRHRGVLVASPSPLGAHAAGPVWSK